MRLPHVGLGFSRIARHRRVTLCLGDAARLSVEDIAAFRIPGDRLIKLPVAT